MEFIIGTGYHYRSEWDSKLLEIWKANTEKYSSKYYCISTTTPSNCKNDVFTGHNLGHVGDLISNDKPNLCGWSASVLALAMIAYNCGADFIYKESDCLWFGDVVSKMYEDLGDCQMVIGRPMTSPPYMPCSQSTFLIKHSFILDFVQSYLRLPRNDKDCLPEHKFMALPAIFPNSIAVLSFGIDRERPIDWDADIWFCQQWTEEELNIAKQKKLI